MKIPHSKYAVLSEMFSEVKKKKKSLKVEVVRDREKQREKMGGRYPEFLL